MSDIDDDLLALAGGAVSSDEEEATSNRGRGMSRSPPPAKKDASATKDGIAKKAKKPKARATSDDSAEEGEASSAPSSPRSEQSVPMDESDSDDDRRQSKARDDEEDKYPVEGMFLSHAEKAHIMSLREIEREEILAERAQEKEKMIQNRLLRQLVSNNELQKKRTASSAGLDDDRRKTSRVRTKIGGTRVGESNSALDTLKKARAEKNERTRRREEDKERRKDRSPSFHDEFEDDGDADSEVDWAGPSKSKTRDAEPKKEDLPAELDHIQRVRLSRSRFGQVCFTPGFEKAMVGCYVRISIGPDRDTGENTYRMAVIKGITKGREYATDGAHGTIITDQYVTASHGKATRDWPFIACSNSPFTDSEWKRFKSTCMAEGEPLPTESKIEAKIKDLNTLLTHSWTNEEVSEKIERLRKLKARFQGHDRLELEQEIAESRAVGNHDRVKMLEEKLGKLGDAPRLAFRTSLTPQKKAGTSSDNSMSQQERLAQLNIENRKRNRDVVRKAQLKERTFNERKLERSQSQTKSPSKGSAGVDSGSSTPADGTPNLGAQKSALLPHLAKLQQSRDKKGLPTIHKPLMDDEIIGALDLDIDENIVL
ncbi:hypothetical protein MAPG_05558 [Magnaporthiopsis poae ATCC 64411]|uniref:Plus3 domain-containing protein n=1 Tax=Magnaporthiopsis poae (strain ATCC 64411 / 73-15) TaxID=644358 RepID=A0A0C4DZQ2_MAGP6|nr:hypothetical protein MAPG_05558 [Magnaporthiopsis poae ATCC 64411]